MKLENISDVKAFFEAVDQCKGKIELVSPEGDRINLKSKLSQYLSIANMCSNGYIKELELVVHEDKGFFVRQEGCQGVRPYIPEGSGPF